MQEIHLSLRAEKRRPQNRLSPYSDRIFLLFLERARRRTRKSIMSFHCTARGRRGDKGAGQLRQLFIAQEVADKKHLTFRRPGMRYV
jgi:hypothetical protein